MKVWLVNKTERNFITFFNLVDILPLLIVIFESRKVVWDPERSNFSTSSLGQIPLYDFWNSAPSYVTKTINEFKVFLKRFSSWNVFLINLLLSSCFDVYKLAQKVAGSTPTEIPVVCNRFRFPTPKLQHLIRSCTVLCKGFFVKKCKFLGLLRQKSREINVAFIPPLT